tara:strand:+ start:10661 stop:10999 length:339 start_codon:yes stop_codon:yes gene_type:complete
MRNKKRLLAFNDNELYSEHFEKRGVNFIEHYTTPVMHHASPQQLKSINTIQHVWTHADKYYKLAYEYYNDSEKWWVIAWFNKLPTESHINIGDLIFIPVPLGDVLKIYGLYY